MKKIIVFFVILLILTSMAVIEFLSNPLRKSEEHIQADLLDALPIGTCMNDVITMVENHRHWKVSGRIMDDIGIIVGPRGPSIGYPLPDEEEVGVKSMELLLGNYHAYFLIETHVSAFIAFDKNSELIDIAIRKSMNVL